MQTDHEFTKSINLLNVVCTILIVYIHTYNASAYGLHYQTGFDGIVLCFEDVVSQGIAHVAVPFFFFISGYLFFLKCSKDDIPLKIARRVKSLLVPYLIWNLVYFILFACMGNLPFVAKHLNSVTGDISLNAFVAGVLFYKSNYIMWYVYQLMIYVVLTPLIFVLVKSNVVMMITVALLFTIYSLGCLEIPNFSVFTIARGVYPDMLLYFLIGAWFGFRKPLFKIRNNYLSFILLSLATFIWILNRQGYKEWIFFVGNISYILLVIVAIVIYKSSNPSKGNQLVDKLKPHTFIIFVLHPFVVEVYQKLMYIIMPHCGIGAMVDYIISPVLTIFTCVLFSKFFKKLSPRFYSIVVGGRVCQS